MCQHAPADALGQSIKATQNAHAEPREANAAHQGGNWVGKMRAATY